MSKPKQTGIPVRDGVTRCPSVILTIDDWRDVLLMIQFSIEHATALPSGTAEMQRIAESISIQVKP